MAVSSKIGYTCIRLHRLQYSVLHALLAQTRGELFRPYTFHAQELRHRQALQATAGVSHQLTWSGRLVCAAGGSSAFRGPLEEPSGAQGGRAREIEAAPCARAQSPGPAPGPS